MEKNLVDYLQEIEDYRGTRGRRYPLWLLLLLVILGGMSGAQGYSALEDFARRHHAVVCQQLSIAPKHVPSDSTFRRLFEGLPFERLSECFNRWAIEQIGVNLGEFLAVDGKGIRRTVSETYSAFQNFVNLVSVYSQQQGVVLATVQFENGQQSEIQVVQNLLEQLHLAGVVYSLDALHAQKKH